MIPGVPLMRGFRVFLTLRSGRREAFNCDDFTVRQMPGASLGGLAADRAPAFPDFLALNEVVAITSIKIIRLRPLRWADALVWFILPTAGVLLRWSGLWH